MAKQNQPLSARLVQRLKPGEIAWDSELLGFGVIADAGEKTYFFESAIGGQARRYRIGDHGKPWAPDNARTEAWRLKSDLIRQVDAGGGRGRRVTEGMVAALKPRQIIWDGEIKGFGVRCQRTAKVYFLKARVRGRQRWLTIGSHGDPWTTEQARQEAGRLLRDIATGKALDAEASAGGDKITVTALCDRYLAEGVSDKKDSTVATDRGRIERHIKPLLGRKRANRVTRADVERFLADVAEGRTAADVRTGPRGRAIVTGGAGTAYRTVGLLSAIFGFAVDRGLCVENPARGFRPQRGEAGSDQLSGGDLCKLGATLRTQDRDAPVLVALIRFLLWSDLRLSEALAVRWGDLDERRGFVQLAAGPNEGAYVPLCQEALATLHRISRDDEAVFADLYLGQRQVLLNRFWKGLRSQSDLAGLRLQDLKGCLTRLGPAVLEEALALSPQDAPQGDPFDDAPFEDDRVRLASLAAAE